MSSWSTEKISPSPCIAIDHAGSGPLVILLHGVGGNRTFWRKQIAALAPHFHAVAWDARGYGESDDFEGPAVIEEIADDLLRVIDYFGAQKAHIVALSIGGIFAMNFYSRYPDRVASLTLCCTGKAADLTPEARAEFMRLRKQPLLEGKTPRDIAPEVARSLVSAMAVEGAYEQLHDGYVALRKETLLRMIDAGMTVTDIDFASIRVPTHIMVGEHDQTSPPAMMCEVANEIPGAEFSIIPNAGHICNVDQPDAFNEAMLSFLVTQTEAGN